MNGGEFEQLVVLLVAGAVAVGGFVLLLKVLKSILKLALPVAGFVGLMVVFSMMSGAVDDDIAELPGDHLTDVFENLNSERLTTELRTMLDDVRSELAQDFPTQD